MAEEYGEAVQAVVDGFADKRQEEEERKRTAVALGMWRRFLKGLRIVEHVKQYETQEEKAERRIREAMDRAEEEMEDEEAGGFFPDAMQRDAAEPSARRARSGMPDGDSYGGGFVPDGDVHGSIGADVDYGGGSIPEEPQEPQGGGFMPDYETAVADGGGFMAEDDEGGGFMPQDEIAAEGGGFVAAEPAEHTDHEDVWPDPGRRRRRRVQLSSSDEDEGEDDDEDVVMSGALPTNGSDNRESTAPEPLVSDGEAGGFIREKSAEGLEDGNGIAASSPDDEQYDDDADSATQEAIAQSLEEMYGSTYDARTTEVAEGHTQPIDDTNDAPNEAAQSLSTPPTVDQQMVDGGVTSSDERGSLLSHDPEDEDAEPEWLMSD